MRRFIILVAFLAANTNQSLAHQPRLNQSLESTVLEPEISKAYYGVLTGAPHVYHLNSQRPFNLYVNILTPFSESVAPKVSVRITRNNDPKPIAILDGASARWTEYFEPYGHDFYLLGPEFRM